MTPEMALDLLYESILLAGKLSAPILLSAVVVGVLSNVIQTITSIKDMSLTFVPKMVAAAIIGGLTMPWGINIVVSFFHQMFQMFAQVTPMGV
ncbi:MAG: flagellar export apparatus protein FliQ [Spartobacteria bacterium]|nr:flagellar export apparatus protein FliQ [Spartobacteria bacterium]